MNGNLWLPQASFSPAPKDICAYLLQQGWLYYKSTPQWAEYTKTLDGEKVFLEIPQRHAARDYPRAIGMLLEDLSRLESRASLAILRDIQSTSIDIVRLAIDSPVTKDGRIPVEAGRRVYEASRDLLVSAACSVIDPKPVFAQRKPQEVMKLLDRARFGHSEIGSFILTMECSVAPYLQQHLLPLDNDPHAPLERRVCIKLAQALQEMELATREAMVSGGQMEPFEKRTKEGVSANLCEAVAEVIEATSADTLIASFSFGILRPLLNKVPQRIVFSSDTAPILREAAARLRDEAVEPDKMIVGPVVKLDSTDATQGGNIVIKASFDGQFRSVRISLNSGLYQQAIQAHRDYQLVRCTGELIKDGRSLALNNVRSFSLLGDSEEV